MRRITTIIAGSDYGQSYTMLQMVQLFGRRIRPGVQIGIPEGVTMEVIQRDPMLARNLVEEALDREIRRWPFAVKPGFFMLNLEPVDNWSFEDTVNNGFDKYDERAVQWMIDVLNEYDRSIPTSLYRVPHVLRRREMTPTERRRILTAKHPLKACSAVTTNHYVDQQTIIDDWDQETREMHKRRISTALDLVSEIAGDRPNMPMIWTGWIDRPSLRDHFEILFEALKERPHITDLCVWMNAEGEDPWARRKVDIQMARLESIGDLINDWIKAD